MQVQSLFGTHLWEKWVNCRLTHRGSTSRYKIEINWGSGRGLVVRVLDSGLYDLVFDPHTGHGPLLKLRQFR